ncbi:hypothetical protein ACFSL4_01795 [Streptomyces caeni]|uniref:Tail assembly chaperone n=1 Tax=Streptomyces caeni TaxID=2307231 RepID=A0ABW4II47_9ACTN
MIKVTVGDQIYEFDDGRLLVAEAREIKTLCGLTPPRMYGGLEEGDPDSVAAIVFLAKKRAGEPVRWSDLDQLDFADVTIDPITSDGDGQDGDAAENAEVDPTTRPVPPNSGPTPSDGTGSISEPSPTASNTTQATSAG